MLLALFLFGSGTFLCSIAPSMGALITARAIAGMGGGGSAPLFHFCGYNLKFPPPYTESRLVSGYLKRVEVN